MYRLATSKVALSAFQRAFGNNTSKQLLTKRVVKQTGQVRWNAGSIGGPPPHGDSMGFGFFMQTMGGIGALLGGYYLLFNSGENARAKILNSPLPQKAAPVAPPAPEAVKVVIETPAPEPVASEAAAPEAAASEAAAPEAAASEPAASEEAAPEAAASEPAASEEAAPEEAAPEAVASEAVASEAAAPEAAAPEAAASDAAAPEAAAPKEVAPETPALKEAAPEAAPETPSPEAEKASTGLAEIPSHVPYVIVGAGTAAIAASRAIKDNEPNAKVLMIGEEAGTPYKRPPLSKQLWFTEDKEAVQALTFKHWNGKDQSIFFESDDFFLSPAELLSREEGGVALLQGTKVVDIDVEKRSLKLQDGRKITYEKCLLATGGRPKNIPVIEAAGEEVAQRVTLFRNISDFRRLYEVAQKKPASVAIVGGGFMGSELACALGRQEGVTVTQSFPEPGNMGKVLPAYLSKWAMDKVRKEGVTVLPETSVTMCQFDKDKQKVNLTLNNDQTLSVDHVVVAVGLQPSVELSAAGLEISESHGGFLVNAELEARRNVWVAGDAACFYDIRLGRRRVEHHDHAVVSGRLAGNNMSGLKPQPYTHQSYFWSDLGPEVGYEAIGLVDSSLPTVAVFAKATDQDTPKALAESQAKEGTATAAIGASKKVEEVETSPVAPPPSPDAAKDNYGKGVVFYLKDKKVVGVLLWNVFKKLPLARQVLADGITEDELVEGPISKAFHLHED